MRGSFTSLRMTAKNEQRQEQMQEQVQRQKKVQRKVQRPPGWAAFVLELEVTVKASYWRSSVQLVPPLGS